MALERCSTAREHIGEPIAVRRAHVASHLRLDLVHGSTRFNDEPTAGGRSRQADGAAGKGVVSLLDGSTDDERDDKLTGRLRFDEAATGERRVRYGAFASVCQRFEHGVLAEIELAALERLVDRAAQRMLRALQDVADATRHRTIVRSGN